MNHKLLKRIPHKMVESTLILLNDRHNVIEKKDNIFNIPQILIYM